MSKRDIPKKVKEAVYKRDYGLCILCGRAGAPNAHFIARSQGGLGIEENIITLCHDCHFRYDQTTQREVLRRAIRVYLERFYPNFPDEKRKEKNRWYR